MIHIEPKLRFKEFHENWKNHKITDFLSRVSKHSNDNDDLPRVEYENIKSGFGKLIMKPENNHKNGILFNENDILFGKLRPYLNNYLKPKFNGVAVGDFWVFRPKKNVNSMFVYDLIQSERYQKVANHSAGSKMPRSDWNLVSSVNFKIPSVYEEQRQIGLFFDKIDNLIELKSDKIAILERLKRGYLQKLFTDPYENKSKLRFKGFNASWSINKVKDLTIVNPKNTEYKDTFNYVDLNSVKNGNLVSYRAEKYKNAPSRAKRIAKIYDIFYQTVRPYQNNNLYFNVKSNEQFVFSTGYAQIRADKVNSKMLFYYFLKYEFNQKVINLCTGTSFPAISSNDLANIKISVPKSTEEQSKIGTYMTLIDKQINLQQKELDRLKSLKKGYLQKMFI